MEERGSGIILRTRPLTETSLIVQWLSADLGRISTVAKGARRRGSPFLGKLDFCFEADFSFIRSRRSELHTLKEVILRETHSRLRREMEAVAQAAYFCILIERATETETPLPEIWQLFTEAVAALAARPPRLVHLLAFELKLLKILGAGEGIAAAPREARTLLEALGTLPWIALGELPWDERLARNIDQRTRLSIGALLGRIPKQRDQLLRGSFQSPGA